MGHSPAELLAFWFSDQTRPRWFAKDPAFDSLIRDRFAASAAAAAAGALDGWSAEPESCLALVLLLDQVPRNIHRGTPRAFAADAKARQVADLAIGRGFDARMTLDRRWFFYLPFEHSEDPADQQRSVALFRRWAEAHEDAGRERAFEQVHYALRHQEVIARFGRFPHRNQTLGRDSTPAEIEFLAGPDAAF
jgi:uncharacterized protein (DUF924 family)